MKLPAIQWYPGDWRKDPGIQSLDFEARGIWFEMLMMMWESEERGKLMLNGRAMTEDEIARAIGCDQAKFKQTATKLVASGVAKVEQNTGAFCNRRMLKDEHLRQIRREAGRHGGMKRVENLEAKRNQKSTPSSSSSVSSSTTTTIPPRKIASGKGGNGHETWMTAFGIAWRDKHNGEFLYGRWARSLKQLAGKYGEEKTIGCFRNYIASQDNVSFLTPEKFLSTFGKWDDAVPKAKMYRIPSKWKYEKEKREIDSRNLPPAEYEQAVKELAQKMGV